MIVAVSPQGSDPGAMPLLDYFEQIYRPACFKARFRSKTRCDIRLAVHRFLEFSKMTITIAEVSPELLDEFALSPFGVSRQTNHPLVSIMRKMLSCADPERFLHGGKPARKRFEPLTHSSIVPPGKMPEPEHDLTLLSLFELLYRKENSRCSQRYAAKFRTAIKYLRWFLSREPKLTDLHPCAMPDFYSFCMRRGLAISSVRDYRASFVRLLRYAAKTDLLDYCPELPSVIKQSQRVHAIGPRPLPHANTLQHFFEYTVWPTRLHKFSEATRRDYERAVREFLIFCGSRDVKLEEVTEQRIAEFRRHLEASESGTKGKGKAYEHSMRMRFILRCTEPDKFPKMHGHNRAVEPTDGGGLRKFVATYLSERDISKGYRDQFRWMLNEFGGWLKREPELTDLNKETVNLWLDSILARNVARVSVQNKRRMMLTLWRAAYEVELLDALPRRVKKIKVPRTVPKAWSWQELQALLQKAGTVDGAFKFSKVSKRAFWKAIILLGYDSGLRLVDILALTRMDITTTADGFGVLGIIQHKTGVPHAARLYPETLAAITAICKTDEPRIFWALSRDHVMEQFGVLARSAGLKGGLKMLRKAGATSVHCESPGAAMGYLGHLTPALGFRHYIDLAQAAVSKPMPQRLVDIDAIAQPLALPYMAEPAGSL